MILKSTQKDRKMNQSDKEFLQNYDASIYEHPSVTVDILIFTADLKGNLEVLLIQRDIPPYQGCWAIPGGFVGIEESLEDAARRKLREETGIEGIPIEQLYTFGDVNRDPRTRVITVTYFALLPKSKIQAIAGEGVRLAGWQKVVLPANTEAQRQEEFLVVGDHLQLAFDHAKIIETAIQRLRGKISYSDIAFGLLGDPDRFAIYELQKIYEAILGTKQDTANFRRMFLASYLSKGLVEATGEECYEYSRRASQYYRKL